MSLLRSAARPPLLVALFAALLAILLAGVAAAQQIGPVGPGPLAFDGAVIEGRFVDWDRTATPRLVLQAPGNRVLRPFADIAPEGAFAIVLPEVGPDTPLGSTICGAPGAEPITVLFDIDLLTTLDGFTTPSEANGGLSAIGMAIAADAPFATEIGAPGTRALQWFASRADRTVAAGECNNTEAFEIGAGWTAVTIEYGPSGGPHTFRPGIEEGIGWYWWAFAETAAEAGGAAAEPAPREQPSWMVGSWRGVDGGTEIRIVLGADGAGLLEATQGDRTERFEGTWSIGDGRFELADGDRPIVLPFEADGETAFLLFPERDAPGIPFVRDE